jgi:hypothetical protein
MRTLGDADAAGEIDSGLAARLEQRHGPNWRDLTVQEALDASAAWVSNEDQLIAADRDEAARAGAMVLAAKTLLEMRNGRLIDDEMIAAVIAKLYGDTPTPEQVDLVLEVISGVRARIATDE